jgi:orotate phosphoribosyltransferase
MSEKAIEKMLRDNGAILKGHFLLTSGLHSDVYFEKFMILEKPQVSSLLCSNIALHFCTREIDKVIGPTTGGTILAYEVAKQLGILAGIAEDSGEGKRVIKRGSAVKEGERILIVDDVLTTGGSLKATIDAVEEMGGKVVGVGVLIDRSEQSLNIPYPFYAVYEHSVENYKPDDCPLCKKGIPLMRRGGKTKNI